jgi:hypothetical protein
MIVRGREEMGLVRGTVRNGYVVMDGIVGTISDRYIISDDNTSKFL